MRAGIVKNFIEPNQVQIEDERELVTVTCDEVGAEDIKFALLSEDAILAAYDENTMELIEA